MALTQLTGVPTIGGQDRDTQGQTAICGRGESPREEQALTPGLDVRPQDCEEHKFLLMTLLVWCSAAWPTGRSASGLG